ncbi:uncharacterized protein BYT42DRAFT_179029 [Radiomyces spectabilis]|uniref:uncharacterized protein n=1 Tax=Radiomyces spectabilis TaxID=64574 RepID=UPI00221FB087|nr:uncharacterized protein BYT42DRAFT_179029 [Radiomyces spectabilis]KAI8391020.1 hypothetical protein BYT42DRAFT_179029 [Radiomyces spectabilis]
MQINLTCHRPAALVSGQRKQMHFFSQTTISWFGLFLFSFSFSFFPFTRGLIFVNPFKPPFKRPSGMPLCTHRLLPFHNNTAEDRLLPRMTDDTLCNEEWEHVSISKKMSLESCGSGYPKPSVLGIADRAMLTPPTVATPVSPRTTNDPPPVPPKEPSYFIQCGHHRRSPQTPPTPPPKDPHYLAQVFF